jgi:hypothetical protein
MRTALLLSLFVFSIAACSTVSHSGRATTASAEKILFLAYEVERKNETEIMLKPVQQILADGSFKQTESSQLPSDNDFIFFFMDAGGKKVSELRVADPTMKELEGVNEEGKLVRQTVKASKAELTFRIMYQPRMKTVKVFSSKQMKQPLFEHSLSTNS